MLCFCFVCLGLVSLMLPVSLDCPLLIALRYSLTFLIYKRDTDGFNPTSPPVLSAVRVARSSVFCVVFCVLSVVRVARSSVFCVVFCVLSAVRVARSSVFCVVFCR